MREKKNSPDKLKQTKITAFCSTSNSNLKNLVFRANRKRKNATEISEFHKTPTKRPTLHNSKSPELQSRSSPERNCDKIECRENLRAYETKSNFENFFCGDFENDPFLSPVKKESPKKNVLTENLLENLSWLKEKSEINFETPVKCKIVKASFSKEKLFEQILQLREMDKIGICKLRDVWTSLSFSIDDVVCIQATHFEGDWIVDNKSGYIILYPDVMLSSTALTSSMYCMRQGLLSNLFKGLDPENNGRMLIGRLVHELFQESLKTGADSDEDLCKIISNFMESRNNLQDFFFNNVNFSDLLMEMRNFIPRVRKFLDVYVNKKEAPIGNNFKGTIDGIVDIEELIKSPTLGFQGRIDVTVKLRKAKAEKIAPLELKTGRASFSKEHRSQLILYILLMNELGRKADSGLLLYLRENILEEISPQRDEIRNLFLLRNHFVGFFKSLGTGVLPEPIRNVKGCIKCPHLRICTSYLRGKKCDQLSQTHPLMSIDIPDVKSSHVDYFMEWNKMLCLEYEEVFEEVTGDHETSELTLEPNVESFREEFKCNFRKSIQSKNRMFRSGTFVTVMNGKNNQVCRGQIIEVTESLISVLTDRRLCDFSDVYSLIISKSKFLHSYLSNLGWFLNEEYKSLRELIVERRPPKFEKNFNKADFQEKCLKHLLNLNKEQQKAILKSLLCQDYLLIKGPPGTGKTQTIVTLIKILLVLNNTVLIASHTHSSVDNILLRLDDVEYLRLGSLKSIHKEVRKNSFGVLVENCSSVDDIKKLFDRKLIATTCLGIDIDFVRKVSIDYCIIDESSQVLQAEILRPLFCCKKFILVGDEDQLPPIVRNPEARKLGMDKSLFEWLSSDLATVTLKLQYRMNSVINSLANSVAYDGLIECGNEEVAKATMKIPDREIFLQEDEWVVEILSNDLEKSVIFVDSSEYFRLTKANLSKRSSKIEANIVVRLITCLIKCGLREESIGVIAPFWDQITLLATKLKKENLQGIDLNTVDQYQGRDKEVILISCTKENQADEKATELELLNDKRRLTVALTRAKHKLIIVGDKQTLIRYEPFSKLLKSMNESQLFCLSNGKKNFFWENFVN